ncbi:aldehyde dehydrogenase family protein [Actinomadura rudentiformis]|uniref:aldehyde dehydrogenase (NAD(+)) n=1 Tax=Actinomadura rudentiformis TaxID=359158 RepID=A0A6H9Y9Y1_9ACTN|nr:aldehyde dehydrogenase family protein [Actinomadura rudentiformis]KAB2340391.1 aldehyde dehydrogenase family protein [Actinomadura rudentiformis]
MRHHEQVDVDIYVDGVWSPVTGGRRAEVHEAATGALIGSVPLAEDEDVDRAVEAARAALPAWAAVPIAERVALLHRIADGIAARREELAELIAREVGTPIADSRRIQVDMPAAVLRTTADLAETELADERIGHSVVVRNPVGVVAMITPWNYPLYQIAAKIAPALAAGCTCVVKPSTVAPLSAFALAEIAHEAGLPAGVLNVLTGTGAGAGERLAAHPQVDMVSLTGSTAAGARVGELAARTIKRVALELGGKSALIVTENADLDAAMAMALRACFVNNGQTCAALTRLLMPRSRLAEAEERLAALAAGLVVGDPLDPVTSVGPLASAAQQRSVLGHIEVGAREGTVLTGPGARPRTCKGFFAPPTIISRLPPEAVVSQEEIFGPVLAVIPVQDAEEAIRIADACDYGLSGGVWAADVEAAQTIARRLRTGQVSLNGGRFNVLAPFGGYRKSGNGRELGRHGLAEYVELTSLQLPV